MDLRPAVIISDYRMAGLDGVFVLKKAKALLPATQRIMLTGHADMETVEEAINEGEVDRFLSKPWDLEQLLVVVESAVEKNRLVVENERLVTLTAHQNEQPQRWRKVWSRKSRNGQRFSYGPSAHGKEPSMRSLTPSL